MFLLPSVIFRMYLKRDAFSAGGKKSHLRVQRSQTTLRTKISSESDALDADVSSHS